MNWRRVGDCVREVRVELGFPPFFCFLFGGFENKKKRGEEKNWLKIKKEEKLPGCAVGCEHI